MQKPLFVSTSDRLWQGLWLRGATIHPLFNQHRPIMNIKRGHLNFGLTRSIGFNNQTSGLTATPIAHRIAANIQINNIRRQYSRKHNGE